MLNVKTATSAAEFDNTKGSRRFVVRGAKTPNKGNFNTIVRVNARLGLAMVSVPEYADDYRGRRVNPPITTVKDMARLLQSKTGKTVVNCHGSEIAPGGRTHYVFSF